nr:unknown [Zea mays]
MTGDVLRLKDSKVPIIADSLKQTILKEHEAASKASYGVSAILSSAGATCRSRSEGLLSLLSEESSYNILKFDIGSCVYIDFNGSSHNIELDSFEAPKADLLMPFSAKLVDGINQNDSRRRALVMFCFAYFNVIARSAVMLSIDHHGFDVLAKVPQGDILTNPQYHWKEFRFTFKEPAKDAEDFCRMLVGLEEEGLQTVKSCSGYG